MKLPCERDTHDDLEPGDEVLQDEEEGDVGAVREHGLEAVRQLVVVVLERVEVVVEACRGAESRSAASLSA